MATLVFNTVGTILGGPVGGAIGALIGQSIDQELLGPRGPKLGDLKVQSSDYGTQMPRVYGRMRVAGSVIWATDLIASEQTSGAKGQSSAVTSYQVSFAVALSSRPALSVGRIWADGKLLRGADGVFKVSTVFRFYDGSEDQIVDPLIASIEGIALTPAYRGLALAVFETLELAEYGNRIPFLTFELIADAQAPDIGTIISDSSRGSVAVAAAKTVIGYAAYGANVRAAVKPLIEAHGIDLFDDGALVRVAANAATMAVAEDDFGNSADHEQAAKFEREMAPARSLPAALRLSYYEPERDYQSGEARASAGEQAGGEERRELAAVMTADDAKSLAHQMIARSWAGRDRLMLRLPPAFINIEPGSSLSLGLSPSLWTVDKISIDGLVAIAELKPWWQPSPALAGDPGRVLSSPDLVAAPATLALVEVPAESGTQSGGGATLMLAASSPAPAWRSQALTVSAGGREFQSATPRLKSVLGTAETALLGGQPYILDKSASVIVALIDPDQWLESCDADALAAGVNLAAIGNELIQFLAAVSLGGGRFNLSGLLRGRGGSEWAMASHAAGDTFVLLDRARLARIDLPASMIGASAEARVVGSGSAITSGTVVITGEIIRPPAPVTLTAATAANGDLTLNWVRRSRDGFAWIDEIDAPLGEASEQYRVTISASTATATFVCSAPQLTISAAALAPLGSGPATVDLRQIGDRALSRPATLAITL
ncbi:MAG: phage tail protein [Pseudomonadota bacterium]